MHVLKSLMCVCTCVDGRFVGILRYSITITFAISISQFIKISFMLPNTRMSQPFTDQFLAICYAKKELRNRNINKIWCFVYKNQFIMQKKKVFPSLKYCVTKATRVDVCIKGCLLMMMMRMHQCFFIISWNDDDDNV